MTTRALAGAAAGAGVGTDSAVVQTSTMPVPQITTAEVATTTAQPITSPTSTATSAPTTSSKPATAAASGTAKGDKASENKDVSKGKSDTAAIAGTAAGCLVGGLIIGALIALILLRKKFNRRIRAMQSRHDLEKEDARSSSPKELLYTAPYGDSSAHEAELEDARKRIKALEVERNAASSFGDTLDGHSEQELLDSPTFGLKTFNEKLHQMAMSISVSSGTARKSNAPLPQSLGLGSVALEGMGREKASQDIEAVVRHVINSVVYDRICVQFCFIADGEASNNVARVNSRIERQFDQAMAARWRIMSHKTLEQSSEDPTGKKALFTIQRDIFDALVGTLLWTGVDDSRSSASNLVDKNFARVGELTKYMSALMHIVRQEMATATYQVDTVSNSKSLVLSLGLSTRSKGSSKKARVILEAK